ncbi:interleukin-31 receptor subunit alpha-like [Clarias gariepinus]|uniref:interleukin-5 receptor subunit alpha-like n=1 Tax=Clarias gariepinus TaxID=13013 RepID=UPI00234DFE66|nr:interleukin-5 receptor subunit alpha-like [Clarias gariepinus]
MRLCGLLLALSLVLADDYDYEFTECDPEKCTNEILTNDHENHMNSSNSKNRFDIKCIIYNTNLLSCFWSIYEVPEDASYSASCQLCNTPEKHWNCISEGSKKSFRQLEKEKVDDDLLVKVNVSINGYWYIICKYYSTSEIEKLEPPQNITTLIKSTNIEIQWMQPRSLLFNTDCFDYELKINDELHTVTEVLKYNITNFEPTTKYIIIIRVRQKSWCGGRETTPWSDWSQPVEVNPSNGTWELNVGVIAAIAFVLPMILLAFLLICKFQRLFEKVFPSIPNPSKNVQMLLEQNDFNQVIPPKQCEEGTEILEVIS